MKKLLTCGIMVAVLLTGCAPAYYGSLIWDIETTVACSTCGEANPLVPNSKSRVVHYPYAALWATAVTLAAKGSRYPKLIYGGAAFLHFLAGTLNLRYLNHSNESPNIPNQARKP